MNGKIISFSISAFIFFWFMQTTLINASQTDPKGEYSQKTDPISIAKIKFENEAYDFGNIDPNTIYVCKFRFSNAGTKNLKIERLLSTCKCIESELTKSEYAPGESGEITVKFKAPKYQGQNSHHIIVPSNDCERTKISLQIKAYVKTAVQVYPENIKFSLIDSKKGTEPVTIESIDNERFSITEIECTSNAISFEFNKYNISNKHALKPVVNTRYLSKNLNGTIMFKINHSKCKEVRVRWTCLKEFEINPTVFIVRNAIAGESLKRKIYIKSNYNQPFEVESIYSDLVCRNCGYIHIITGDPKNCPKCGHLLIHKDIIKVTNVEHEGERTQISIDICPQTKETESIFDKTRYGTVHFSYPKSMDSLNMFSDMLHIKIKGKDEILIPCHGFYKAEQ